MSIEPAGAADLDAVLAVQAATPGAARWSRRDYQQLLTEPGHLLLVARAETLAGFLAARTVADECEILNLAVAPERQGRGVGAALLRAALAAARERGARGAWLEVRESNQRARRFYRSFGFREAYRRPRFYENPPEDAIVCSRALTTPAA